MCVIVTENNFLFSLYITEHTLPKVYTYTINNYENVVTLKVAANQYFFLSFFHLGSKQYVGIIVQNVVVVTILLNRIWKKK